MMDEEKRFAEYCIIELMGHQQLIGYVTERSLGGANMLRVDVPEIPASDGASATPAFTKYVSSASIYAITPVSEEFARAAVVRVAAKPHTLYVPELYPQEESPRPKLLAATRRYVQREQEDYDDQDDRGQGVDDEL